MTCKYDCSLAHTAKIFESLNADTPSIDNDHKNDYDNGHDHNDSNNFNFILARKRCRESFIVAYGSWQET